MQLQLSPFVMVIFYPRKVQFSAKNKNKNVICSVFQSSPLPFLPPKQTWANFLAGVFFLFMHDCCDSPWRMSLLEGLHASPRIQTPLLQQGFGSQAPCVDAVIRELPEGALSLCYRKAHGFTTVTRCWRLALPHFNLSNLPLSLIQTALMLGAERVGGRDQPLT